MSCRHCGGDAIDLDGPRSACRGCVALLGRIAASPLSARPEALARLAARSLDVVSLRRGTDAFGQPTASWEWTRSGWPGVGEPG